MQVLYLLLIVSMLTIPTSRPRSVTYACQADQRNQRDDIMVD